MKTVMQRTTTNKMNHQYHQVIDSFSFLGLLVLSKLVLECIQCNKLFFPGRPMVPPPPYPPPPVPHLSRENYQIKGPPSPLPPPSFRKPPSCTPTSKGPPLPYAPHLQKQDMNTPKRGPGGPTALLLPPPGSFATMPVCEKKSYSSLIGNTAATLPIVENLQNMILNPGNKPITSSHHLGSKSTAENKPVSPHLSSLLGNRTQLAQISKPPLPIKPKPSRPLLQ